MPSLLPGVEIWKKKELVLRLPYAACLTFLPSYPFYPDKVL